MRIFVANNVTQMMKSTNGNLGASCCGCLFPTCILDFAVHNLNVKQAFFRVETEKFRMSSGKKRLLVVGVLASTNGDVLITFTQQSHGCK